MNMILPMKKMLTLVQLVVLIKVEEDTLKSLSPLINQYWVQHAVMGDDYLPSTVRTPYTDERYNGKFDFRRNFLGDRSFLIKFTTL